MRRAPVCGVALALLAPVVAACADEPAVHCTIASGTLSAKFTLVTGSPGCDPSPGDVFGVTAYVPNPTNPGNGLSKLAIQSQLLGTAREDGEAADPPLLDANPADSAYAIGDFDSVTPGPDGVCSVSQLAPAALHLAAAGDQAATDLDYQWSHIRILVNAAQIGVQMTGDLTLTQNGCTQTYHVAGLAPSVACAVTDGDGNPKTDDAGRPLLDPSQCSSDNGINPNVKVTCDPLLALCVPADANPF